MNNVPFSSQKFPIFLFQEHYEKKIPPSCRDSFWLSVSRIQLNELRADTHLAQRKKTGYYQLVPYNKFMVESEQELLYSTSISLFCLSSFSDRHILPNGQVSHQSLTVVFFSFFFFFFKFQKQKLVLFLEQPRNSPLLPPQTFIIS